MHLSRFAPDRANLFMTLSLRKSARLAIVLALVALSTACATTRVESQWRDPQYTGPTLKGNKVLVVCRVPDETLRRVCEDQWAMQLGTRGATAVRSYSLPEFPAGGAARPEQIQDAARSTGSIAAADTELALSVVPVVRPAPSVGVGVGGGGWGSGGFSTGGIGISIPIGGGAVRPAQYMAASTGLTGAATGTLIWSGTATAPAADNTAAQISDLVATTIDAIGKSGLL